MNVGFFKNSDGSKDSHWTEWKDLKIEKKKQLVVCLNSKIKNKVDRKIINYEPLKENLVFSIFNAFEDKIH